MKNRNLIIALAIILIAGSLIYTISTSESPLKQMTIDTKIRIAETQGFNLTNSSLDFGKMHPNGSIGRSIKINNAYPFDIYAISTSKGNITPFLNFERQVEIKNNETKKISFNAKAPNKTYKEFNKTYKGNVTLTLWKKPL